MINKLTATDELNLRLWAQQVASQYNNYVQTIDVPVSKSGIASNYVNGKHAARNLIALDTAYFEFIVPHAISQFKEVTVRFIPNVTGSFNYTVNLAYGSVGEAANARTKTVTASASVTNLKVSEIDITSLFTDQKRSDQVGCEFVLNSLTTTTSLDLLSLYIKYI